MPFPLLDRDGGYVRKKTTLHGVRSCYACRESGGLGEEVENRGYLEVLYGLYLDQPTY